MDFQEVWVPAYAWPEYAVSSKGRVKRVAGGRGTRAGHVLSQRTNRDGYACVTLYRLNKKKGFLVNRLVCAAFYGPPPEGDYHAAHIDGDKSNNRMSNVRWATRQENEADKEVHGTRCRGEGHASSKLSAVRLRCLWRGQAASLQAPAIAMEARQDGDGTKIAAPLASSAGPKDIAQRNPHD